MRRFCASRQRLGRLAAYAAVVVFVEAPFRQGAAQTACDPIWHLQELARIGSVDGDDALTSILDLELGPDGNAYITQTFVSSVTVFSPNGDLLRRFGRNGRGPGEFEMVAYRLGWTNDTLWVSDLATTHFLDGDDRELRQVQFRTRLGDGTSLRSGRPLPDGSFVGFRTFHADYSQWYRAESIPLLRLSAQGETLDTIVMVRQRRSVSVGNVTTEHPLDDWLGESRLPVAMTPDASAVVLIGDVIATGSPSFQLLRVSIGGDTVLDRSITYVPKMVDRPFREWLTEAFARSHAGDFTTAGARTVIETEATKERKRAQARRAITFPEYQPPVRRIVAGRDNTIWLLREMELPDLPDRWEVYDSTGSQVGSVLVDSGRSSTLPWRPRLDIQSASADEVWGITIDDLEVPYVHRFRVRRRCGF